MMPRIAMSPRDRRALVIGLAAMCAIVGGSRLVPRWRVWDETARSSSEALDVDVAALNARLRELPAMRDSARAVHARASTVRTRLIGAPTVGAAGARLATEIGNVADDLGIRVGAVQIRPDTLFRAGFARVAVTLSATGDVTHLADLLQSLESSELLLAVRELTVTPADVLAPDERPEILQFQLVVEGLAVQEAASPSRTPSGSLSGESPDRLATR
jgi:hypothetical protein